MCARDFCPIANGRFPLNVFVRPKLNLPQWDQNGIYRIDVKGSLENRWSAQFHDSAWSLSNVRIDRRHRQKDWYWLDAISHDGYKFIYLFRSLRINFWDYTYIHIYIYVYTPHTHTSPKEDTKFETFADTINYCVHSKVQFFVTMLRLFMGLLLLIAQSDALRSEAERALFSAYFSRNSSRMA